MSTIASSPTMLASINPANGEEIARVAQASAEDYEKVMAAATEAFREWRMIPAPQRGLLVRDIGEALRARKQALGRLLADHPHACLTCAQKEGCSRTDCSTNVPVDERCCILLGRCELEKVSDYIGIPGDTPKYIPKKYPVFLNDPLFDRDYNLCIGCLRCVRVCRDVRGVNALGAVWEGNVSKNTIQVTPFRGVLDPRRYPKIDYYTLISSFIAKKEKLQ